MFKRIVAAARQSRSSVSAMALDLRMFGAHRPFRTVSGDAYPDHYLTNFYNPAPAFCERSERSALDAKTAMARKACVNALRHIACELIHIKLGKPDERFNRTYRWKQMNSIQ